MLSDSDLSLVADVILGKASPTDRRHLFLFLSSLDEQDLRSLEQECSRLESALSPDLRQQCSSVLYDLRHAVDARRQLLQYLDRQPEASPLNTPFARLLRQYVDKQGGRVCAARKELTTRFPHLDPHQQMAAMKAFLQGSKHDREWCYRTLLKWWQPCFLDDLLALWEAHREERCGWLLTRHLSPERLAPLADQLSYPSNYYLLCVRLAGRPDFVVDRLRLQRSTDLTHYLWALSLGAETLSVDEARWLVYLHLLSLRKSFCVLRFRHATGCYSDADLSRLVPPADPLELGFAVERFAGMPKLCANLYRLGRGDVVRELLRRDAELAEAFRQGGQSREPLPEETSVQPDEYMVGGVKVIPVDGTSGRERSKADERSFEQSQQWHRFLSLHTAERPPVPRPATVCPLAEMPFDSPLLDYENVVEIYETPDYTQARVSLAKALADLNALGDDPRTRWNREAIPFHPNNRASDDPDMDQLDEVLGIKFQVLWEDEGLDFDVF